MSEMSAEWWKAEADRYCRLHIAAQHKIVAAEARARTLEGHLRELVEWGHGSDAPDNCKTAWAEAARFLAIEATSEVSSEPKTP